mgnify:CR=1 FL=1
MEGIEMQLINERGIVQIPVEALESFVRSVKVIGVEEYIAKNGTITSPSEFARKYGIDKATIMRYVVNYPEVLHSRPSPKKYYLYEEKLVKKMQENGKGKVRAIPSKVVQK